MGSTGGNQEYPARLEKILMGVLAFSVHHGANKHYRSGGFHWGGDVDCQWEEILFPPSVHRFFSGQSLYPSSDVRLLTLLGYTEY